MLDVDVKLLGDPRVVPSGTGPHAPLFVVTNTGNGTDYESVDCYAYSPSVDAATTGNTITNTAGVTKTDGCFLNVAGDYLTVAIPVSGTYPTGLTVGTTAPDNVAVVHFRVTVN